MILVISDASPVRCLAAIDALHLLKALFGRVIIPPAVRRELVSPESALLALSINQIEWIEVMSPADTETLKHLRRDLDAGEAEAIALAMEIENDRLLIDEREGRKVATAMGLRITGVVGILIMARDAGLIPSAGPILRRLKSDFGFWIADAYIDAAAKGDPSP